MWQLSCGPQQFSIGPAKWGICLYGIIISPFESPLKAVTLGSLDIYKPLGAEARLKAEARNSKTHEQNATECLCVKRTHDMIRAPMC
jgi:hypothetical protein